MFVFLIRKSLCERIHLVFSTASRCLHSLCSVDMTALADFATLVCQKNSVFLCKGAKLKNSAKPNSGIVCRFSVLEYFSAFETGIFFRGFGSRLLVRYGFLDAKAGFVGFGLGRLVSNGFLCAKAGCRHMEESFSALEKQGVCFLNQEIFM